MREIVKAEGGKKLQTASRRNRSGVNFVATIVFIMCHLVLLHVNLGTRHHLHFCTGSGTVFLRDRTLSARCVCSAPSAVNAEYMRHIIGDAGGVGRLSDQPADRREPETETARKGLAAARRLPRARRRRSNDFEPQLKSQVASISRILFLYWPAAASKFSYFPNLQSRILFLCRQASIYSYKFSYSLHGNFRTYD
jgi:hypothetical protein